MSSYLEDIKPPQREPNTYMAYKYCLELFASSCTKRFVQDVTREDVLAFIRKLYKLKCFCPQGAIKWFLMNYIWLASKLVVPQHVVPRVAEV